METPPNQSKKLYRSNTDKIIAGVCGGLGKYLNIDPTIIRIAFVILAIINGAGLIIYIILALVISKEGQEQRQPVEQTIKEMADDIKKEAVDIQEKMQGQKSWFSEKRNIIGLIVVVVGFFALINVLFPMQWLNWKIFWPLVLVFIGFYIIIKR